MTLRAMTGLRMTGLGLSALLAGGTMVGCTHGGGIASAGTNAGSAAGKQASGQAGRARKALAAGHAAKAVTLAEAAVALQPRDAGYRALLGRAYLKTGRFASARTAFADTLALAPDNGATALNLALAQIAEGQWDIARTTLTTHADTIPGSDRGLALALAGDPAGGVEVLMTATRARQADAKTRQNLALALALAGRWSEARTVIEVDLPPAEADQRIVQWATFAKPAGAADQVATLLGVIPVKDPGQPVTLALNAAAPVAMQAAAEPVVPVEPVAAIPSPALATAIRFGERREVVQALPVATIAAQRAFKTKLAPSAAAAKGHYYVQLGAFENTGLAKDAWTRAQRRHGAFGDHVPTESKLKSRTGTLYRLSVGGFARSEADALCRTYRAKGGACFVRAASGDRVANWYKPGQVQLAGR